VSDSFDIRPGSACDAVAVAALATQVFLDAYATDGVRPDLAREAFREYSEQAFCQRFAELDRKFALAYRAQGVIGFAELLCSPSASPVAGLSGAELVRLYVQPRAQRGGVGRALLREAERLALQASSPALWLTAWDGNSSALAFYARMGYADLGTTTYSFEGNTYGNRVLAKQLSAA
jgi:GNAT superfamily N-acetyltransferase